MSGPEDLSGLRIEKKTFTTRRSRKKYFIIIAVGVAAAALLYWLHQQQLLQPATEVHTYHVQSLYPSQTFTRLNASGYVVAQRKSAVAGKITAQLVELSVEEGSRVSEGDVIARLEDRDALAARERARANLELAVSNLAQAKAELRDARLDYERNRQLVEKGIVARAQFDKAEARFRSLSALVRAREAAIEAAEAAVQETEVAIEYTYIRAPFDAVVLTKNADIGDIVTPIGAAANSKAAVVTIADMDSLQVEVDVSEANIAIVYEGQPCEIQLDAFPDRRFPGKVYMIVPTADRTKASVLVKVAFDRLPENILPEMSAKVAFLERAVQSDEEKPVLAVPVSSLVEKEGEKHVFVVSGKRAILTRIETGRLFGSMQEITGGIAAGDRVVIDPPAQFAHLTRVSLLE
ncbi:efflux RND transporter periplasmic adaptor subunit [Desulfatiglans anilini]|uniref:efflux RND transporter periplasmic adaptor subunit n=1 Tax=Desulfatiglans anilini TaxID=90728 RepID=UPI0004165D30|nr:efflux RND transporter periplasmic adaptor subunit [Desulfatiglans anilini]